MRNKRTIIIIGSILVIMYLFSHLLFDKGTKRNHQFRSSIFSVNGTLG
jgi:hypothetical protein